MNFASAFAALSRWSWRFLAAQTPGPARAHARVAARRAAPVLQSPTIAEHIPAMDGRDANRCITLTYQSLDELDHFWRELDRADGASQLSIVLVLDESFRGRLRTVVRRRHLAERLVITSTSEQWPGSDSLGDLKLASSSLGWLSIDFEPHACRAIREARQAARRGGRVAAVCPASAARLKV